MTKSFKSLEHHNKAWIAGLASQVAIGNLTRAMRQQGTVKPAAFPVGNRKARRLAASKSKDRPL